MLHYRPFLSIEHAAKKSSLSIAASASAASQLQAATSEGAAGSLAANLGLAAAGSSALLGKMFIKIIEIILVL